LWPRSSSASRHISFGGESAQANIQTRRKGRVVGVNLAANKFREFERWADAQVELPMYVQPTQ
jgi:hypothetical protein